ncbi:LuxR C-terminal-related transcriptional regulator [Anaerovorax odorimutans]|uniref:LuxR C-terminal-related transcriptional regulator n=1 Tax=Anaerovorax odorimutans TaxID=109327 RepID=A0ABT1RJN6_9FIRM|nr:LuxR C-terminal-related transcriptional regulator [Anaerovorax odorimutans]MCQ4635201.1 LuxR C-terminal-related transcriptional regulator [Anaerovorax odorimutans]
MMKLSHEQWEKINQLILEAHTEGDIYRLRKMVLLKLGELIPHDKSFFDLGYKKDTKVVFFDPVSDNMDRNYLTSYFNKYESIDIMFWFFSQSRRNIYRESDYITDVMEETSVYYREWMLPQNIRYSMGSRVAYGEILYGSINLWRSKKHGDFTDEEVYILGVINEHLACRFHNKFPNGIKRNNENDYTDTLVHLYGLTPRESEVVELIYEGLPIRTIGEKLFISENTVKKHTHNIFRKMNISNRSQLMKIVHGYMTTSVDDLVEKR